MGGKSDSEKKEEKKKKEYHMFDIEIEPYIYF